MSKNGKNANQKRTKNTTQHGIQVSGQSRSLLMATAGIRDAADFTRLMSALMSDVVQSKISPDVVNATCNAGGKLLKAIELTYRYGNKNSAGQRTLLLAG